MPMERRERDLLAMEVGELIRRLGDRDSRRLRKALALSGGGQLFVDLIAALYRMPAEQRVEILARLQQMNQLRSFRDG